MRLEDLSNIFQEAIQTFLEINNSIKIIRSNERCNLEFSDLYKKIKNKIIIPPHISEKIYTSKYVRHFYSSSEIDELIEKWSSPR